MGVNIKDILEYDEIKLNSLQNKRIAIDTFNMLYQFLSSIRQADGTPLKDSYGNVTSHLKGLFNRCVYFKKNNIKPIFIFDGKAPKLKEKERELRAKKKMEADKKYKDALELGHIEEAKKFAQSLNKLDEKMIEDSKTLIRYFGFPIIQAPSEGEAQGAQIVKDKNAFAVASQDFDSLLFGAKHVIRNISISNKRKVPGSSVYREVPIEYYDLDKNLEKLNLNQEELIIVGILCGTDFNPGGIKGIGPKKALKLVKEYKDKWDELFNNLDWFSYFSYPWIDVFNTFRKIPVDKDYEIKFEKIEKENIKEFLLTKAFEERTISRSLDSIKEVKTLDTFF